MVFDKTINELYNGNNYHMGLKGLNLVAQRD